jgi:hypothetical protein
MGGAVRCGDRQKIRMSERPDLGVHRIAHQVQPGTVKIGVVPDLLWAAVIAEQEIERRAVPLARVIEDHRR